MGVVMEKLFTGSVVAFVGCFRAGFFSNWRLWSSLVNGLLDWSCFLCLFFFGFDLVFFLRLWFIEEGRLSICILCLVFGWFWGFCCWILFCFVFCGGVLLFFFCFGWDLVFLVCCSCWFCVAFLFL